MQHIEIFSEYIFEKYFDGRDAPIDKGLRKSPQKSCSKKKKNQRPSLTAAAPKIIPVKNSIHRHRSLPLCMPWIFFIKGKIGRNFLFANKNKLEKLTFPLI